MRHLAILLGLGASLPLIGCGAAGTPDPLAETTAPDGVMPAPVSSGSAADRVNEPTEPGQQVATPSGLEYETLRSGDGRQARFGDRVIVHYEATLEGGAPLDSSRERGSPWSHTIGDSRAVQGFNEGVAGMRVGERRRLIVPANLAYGALGTFGEYAPGQERNLDGAMQADEVPSIPPNTTILYEVELLAIEDDPADATEAPGADSDAEAQEGESSTD